MYIKLCGFTREEDVEYVKDLSISSIGFIFYNKSARYVTPERARVLGNIVNGTGIRKAGIFVNETPESIKEIADKADLDIIQLYDRELEKDLTGFRQLFLCHRISGAVDMEKIEKPINDSDLLLFDTYSEKEYGGSGRSFDWKILKNYKYLSRLIVAGGLNSENTGRLLRIVKPYGIDLSSGIEISPGIKSREKIDNLLKSIKEAQNE